MVALRGVAVSYERGTPVHEVGRPWNVPPSFRGQGFNYFTEMCSGSEEGSYLRLIDFTLCITQLYKEEEGQGFGFKV